MTTRPVNVYRTRRPWRALIGKHPVKVEITDGNTTWTAEGRTTEAAWSSVRATVGLFADGTLSEFSPWHKRHMTPIVGAAQSWAVSD